VPVEQITRQTFVSVEFDLCFPRRVSGRQPRMSVEYFWIDLPPEAQRFAEGQMKGGAPASK
jgi:hypothetical protein